MGSTKRKQGNMRKQTRGKEGRACGMEGGKKEGETKDERRKISSPKRYVGTVKRIETEHASQVKHLVLEVVVARASVRLLHAQELFSLLLGERLMDHDIRVCGFRLVVSSDARRKIVAVHSGSQLAGKCQRQGFGDCIVLRGELRALVELESLFRC
jgi:hypothetical protein